MAGTVFDVKTQGVDQLLDRLKGFEADVWKVLQRDVKSAADIIGKSARSLIPGDAPLSHWTAGGRLGWSSSKVAGGIKPSFRSKRIAGTRYAYGLVRGSTDPAGALFALAGSRTDTQFGDAIKAGFGTSYPRTLGSAWTLHVDRAREAIQEAINDAARKVA